MQANDKEFDPDFFFCIEKLKIDLEKSFNKNESEFIKKIVAKCKGSNFNINWTSVLHYFEYEGDKLLALRKIKYHYYNIKSAPSRKKNKEKSLEPPKKSED